MNAENLAYIKAAYVAVGRSVTAMVNVRDSKDEITVEDMNCIKDAIDAGVEFQDQLGSIVDNN
jgi:predicted RecB family endonuclease